MRIVFFGTSSFAAFVLEQLMKQGCNIVAVITRPDRPQGRKLQLSSSPVKEMVLSHFSSIPLFQPIKASDPAFAEQLASFNADLFVVVAYGEIIKENLLSMPSLGCINIHASLLPSFRGAAPMQRALMEGVKETGITIIEMVKEMDAGPILAIEAIPVPISVNLGELEEKLRVLAVKLVLQVIEKLVSGSVVKKEQDHALATLAPKLHAEEEKINWNLPAETIHNQIRALSPSPGAWCLIEIGSSGSKRLKIKKTAIISGIQGPPGTLIQKSKSEWLVTCGQDALQLLEVQLEGKKSMPASDCFRGLPSEVKIKF
ncbi:MAG: methionyl-tRNA formyltransferase [Chlamydiota bacterium]|jgi:methionyl-tRNA formyltransferase